MNRRERRAKARARLRLVKHGERPPEPRTPGVDLGTAAGRFGKALDAYVKQRIIADPELDAVTVLAVVMQFAAGLAVHTGGTEVEFANAAAYFFAKEEAARRPPDPKGTG